MKRFHLLPIMTIWLVSACGAAQRSAAPTASPTRMDEPIEQRPPTTPTMPPPPDSAASGPPVAASQGESSFTEFPKQTSAMKKSASDIDKAIERGASKDDCLLACRALSSMENAAHHICDLEKNTAAAECMAAVNQVADARKKVTSACGSYN